MKRRQTAAALLTIAMVLPACQTYTTSQSAGRRPTSGQQPVDTRSAEVLAAIQTGLGSPSYQPNPGEPVVTALPTANSQRRGHNGPVNLYGEMPGTAHQLPRDSVAGLHQVSFTREGADFDVSISPDGELLVFASTRHRPTADIYIKRIDGNTATQLTNDPAEDRMPQFSPDGSRIAFCSNRSGNWDIYVQELDGGKPVQITHELTHELHPSWSPDGRELIFCGLGEQSGQWEMIVVDVDNPAQRRFIGYGLFPKFSPNGQKIAFQRARFRGTRWFSIWTVDYVDSEGLRPTEIAASSNAAVINPSWSPDGSRLAFATIVNPNVDPNGRPAAADVWVIDVDGTNRTRLTTDHYLNVQPTWCPDGRLFFVSDRGGADNIWSIQTSRSSWVASQDEKESAPASGQASAPTP
jgi:Tol biopolymer transport system component